ncbi:hypothetical protein [Streptacidiphilus albus]|uniref:hypothetical protein n=1 Tax=Streptacidiphilus albus TaxID=105425 RepID=UPI00054BC0B3|nr:hypothetical protein [Streptacidiphilus albus]
MATAEDGSTVVFVRAPLAVGGSPDGLLRRERNSATGQWGHWIDTGGQTSKNPAVGHRLDGGLEVFATRASGHVWFQAQEASGWGAWSDMGTPTGTTAAGTPVVVTDNNAAASTRASGQVQGNSDGRLELFVRGADNAIWHRAQKAPNDGGWSAWEKLGGGPWAGDPAAVVAGAGRIALVARTSDGHLNATSQKQPSTEQLALPTDNWAPWTDLGADFISNPQLVTNAYRTNTGQTSTHGNGTLLQAFANRSDHHPWTIAQSQSGTAATPDGTWDTSHPYDLGLALTSPPVVAVASDGRLSVFGFNADHTVVHRSQTHTLVPGTNATGIWDGGWPQQAGATATALTVTRTASGAFTLIVVDKAAATMSVIDQLAAGTPDSPAGTWLDWSDPAQIQTDYCAGAGSLDCLTIENADLNLDLDLDSAAHEFVTPDAANPHSATQEWALTPVPGATNGTFRIVNHSTLRCMAGQAQPVSVTSCTNPATPLGTWYLEPATTDNTGKPTRYRIHEAGGAYCLTALQNAEGGFNPQDILRLTCGDGDPNHKQAWNLGGNGTTAPGILNLALEHTAAACANDKTSNCTFQDSSTPAPYNAPACVFGNVLYNKSPDSPATLGAEWKHLTGSEWSVGGELSFEPFEFLGIDFSANHTWVDQDETAQTVDIQVPPGQFGWIEESPLVMETIGYWKFSVGGYTYTIPGHNLSNAQDNTGGQRTVIFTNTSPEPPTNAPCNQ